MNPNYLYEHSNGYKYLRRYVRFMHSIYYSEIAVNGLENIPTDNPVIFAPNHQNALMDALAVICSIKTQPVFMARADIFANKHIKKILTFLKIIPVYRIRDGVDSLSNNEDVFDIAMKVLEGNGAIGIMPEGTHGDRHALQLLKKGFARIAFKAQEKLGTNKDLCIIPVGLEYSQYNLFRSKLMIKYGPPIHLQAYMEEYINNPPRALSHLKDCLSEEMKKNMLNIDSVPHYPLIMVAKDFYSEIMQERLQAEESYLGVFKAEKAITDKLTSLANQDDHALEGLQAAFEQFDSGLKRWGLTSKVMEHPPKEFKTFAIEVLRYLFFLPFGLLGAGFHIIPYLVCRFLSSRVEDTQFRSSVKFALMLLVFPLYYLLIMIFPFPLLTKLLILLIMPLLGVLSFDYIFSIPGFWAQWRYLKMERDDKDSLIQLQKNRNKVIQLLDQLI